MDDDDALVYQACCERCGWASAVVTLAQAKEAADAHVRAAHDATIVWPDDAAGEEDAT